MSLLGNSSHDGRGHAGVDGHGRDPVRADARSRNGLQHLLLRMLQMLRWRNRAGCRIGRDGHQVLLVLGGQLVRLLLNLVVGEYFVLNN